MKRSLFESRLPDSRFHRPWLRAIAGGALAAALLALPNRAAASMFEVSFGFSFSHTDYTGGNYAWNRRWGLGVAYNVSELSQIEFAFQDVTDRTKIDGYEDTTFHDQIYSIDWVQTLLSKNYFVQPYVKGGVGQLNREASGIYAGGASPPAIVDSVTLVIGAGLKMYLTKNLGIRGEVTSYLTNGRISSWADNYAMSSGVSLYF